MSARLYTVVDSYDDEEYVSFDGYRTDMLKPIECPHPEEWEAFCLERYGEVKDFFLPASGRFYKSRSAAVERAALINYWGGKAEVLECTPEWQSLAEAKASRERRRLHTRIVKLQDALEVERAKFEAVS